jgi:16S rRNA C1402 N4-methylase RsmH
VTASSAHVTVLLEEAVEALAIKATVFTSMPPSGGAVIAAGFFPSERKGPPGGA